MSLLWYLLSWFFTLTYTDVAAIAWWKAGQEWSYTFLILLLTSTFIVLTNYGIFRGIFWVFRKFFISKIENPSFREKPIVKFFLARYSWWRKRPEISKKWGKIIAETMSKHRYLTLFVLNLIPYVPYLSAATIVAAKLKKIPYAVCLVLAVNAIKVFCVVVLVYTSPMWLGWFKYMIGKIF